MPDPMGLDEIESFEKPINQWSMIVRTARLHGIGDVRVADQPAPTSAAEQTLVRVTAVGICGSDLHWWTERSIGDAGLAHPPVLVTPGRCHAGTSRPTPPARPRVREQYAALRDDAAAWQAV